MKRASSKRPHRHLRIARFKIDSHWPSIKRGQLTQWLSRCLIGNLMIGSVEQTRKIFLDFLTETTGFINLGGQGFDPRHDPSLLRKRRKRDFCCKKVLWSYRCVAGGTFGFNVQLIL